MWRGTTSEMVQLLKSIFRLDSDQHARRTVEKNLRILDPYYYLFETHVLFDDAFEDDENGNRIPSRYVKQLVAAVHVAGAYVHGAEKVFEDPIKISTLYGGYLVWLLPGKNQAVLFVSTILGPATILLTSASALLTAFSTLTIAESYTISVLPPLRYILVFCSTHIQVDEYSRERTEETDEAILQSIRKTVAETQQQQQQLLADAKSRTAVRVQDCIAKLSEEKTVLFVPIRKEHGQELLVDVNPRATSTNLEIINKNMNFIHFSIVLIFIINCFAGPLEDIANMPDLTLFYQQLIRHQDIQMLLQGVYPQQQSGGMNDFTIFAPNNDAMMHLNRKNEDPNLLWKYHIAPGRYDEQILYNMAQTKFDQANPRQTVGIRAQNNLPTIALPFQVFFGLGFYGGTGPHVNESYDNAGYGLGGISWLTHTSLNQTNLFENSMLPRPPIVNNYNQKQNYFASQGNSLPNSPNLFPQNLTNNFNPIFNPNVNTQYLQNPSVPYMNYNPYIQQPNYGQMGPSGNIGVLRPTINNAFILQSRRMSRGIIHVIDNILWPPERRDQTQYKTAYDALEDRQFSRLRQLAERSDYFRSELRSMHHQTWFLPNDQAFASMGPSLSFLFEQFYMNNTNDINEFIKSHVTPLVLYPRTMDSTKQITTLSENKWFTFRTVSQPDHSFQVDVICGRHVARILVHRPEDIRLYGNGIVYPISTILSTQIRSAADELSRSYQYFINLVQQSGDLELMNLLQGTPNMNIYNPQNVFNITVLIPQQMSIQQFGNLRELSMHLRRHILQLPVYTDESISPPIVPNSFAQQNTYQTGLQQQEQTLIPQQQQQPFIPQQSLIPQQQQPFIPQQQHPFIPGGFNQQQQPQFQFPQFQRTGSRSDKKKPRRRRQINTPSNTNFQSQQYSPKQYPNQQQQQNPNYYPMFSHQPSTIFQNDQIYPTMDPQYSIQAQISSGAQGNIVTLVGRSMNSLPFTATILNSESNIPVKNGVMHVIRGIVSGMIIPLEGILTSLQGTSSFAQLLQQTRVFEQLKQTNRPYTLFIPTNAALQSIGTTTNINQLRHFVLRHICPDVLLDPTSNILRRSAGYYNRDQNLKNNPKQQQQSSRQKRQDWMNTRRNYSKFLNRQGLQSSNLGPGYFQLQQQVYGGYPAAPSPFGSNNQLYNPGYVMNGYAPPNSEYLPGYNGTYSSNQNVNFNNLGVPNQPTSNTVWNGTKYVPVNPQVNIGPNNEAQNYYQNAGGYAGGSTYVSGSQSCIAMTGERITVQPLAGTQPELNNPNFIVTCCGDQSVNSMVQSYNVYQPNFAVYLIGRSLLSQGQTINTMYNSTTKLVPSYIFLFIISIILKQTHQF
ncbi:unnamed protein product [Rotaria sp. Silwood2]|nr:unnamed protein product [Rotaria sp. Silwood2]